jgi:hypothetical protein
VKPHSSPQHLETVSAATAKLPVLLVYWCKFEQLPETILIEPFEFPPIKIGFISFDIDIISL